MGNSIYGKGRQVIDNNLKIVDEADQTKKLQWEVSGIASGTTVTMTAPTSDFNFNTPTFASITVPNITPGGDFTLTHNAVNVITSVESGALANALYLKEGRVSIGNSAPGVDNKLHVTWNVNGTRSVLFENTNDATNAAMGLAINSDASNSFTLFQYATSHATFPSTAVIESSGDLFLNPTSSGNVAIGIATPNVNSKLHVYWDVNGSKGIRMENPNAGTVAASSMLVVADVNTVSLSQNSNANTGNIAGVALAGMAFFEAGGGILHTTLNAKDIIFAPNRSELMRLKSGVGVGIGTVSPANPLAVNRSGDGTIVDFESADIVEGTVSISGNATSYNAFVGSHYTQLKDGQSELPVGAVVVSTGEIISCNVEKDIETEVAESEAVDIVTIANAVEEVSKTVEDKENQIDEKIEYKYDVKTDTKEEIKTPVYGTKTIQVKQFKSNICFDSKTGNFCKLRTNIIKKDDKFYLESKKVDNVPNKEYFPYVNTTNVAGDKKVYGVWFGKASDDAKGQSFGDDNKPVYLIAQVGLWKMRVTDLNGNIKNGDYLETSSRPMEAQKQIAPDKLNSTIGKSMIDVDWSMETSDSVLGYKWKLIPVTF